MRRIALVLLAIAALASPVAAQPAFVQGASIAQASATSVTLTLTSPGTAGNVLICTHGTGSQAQPWTPSNNGTAQSWAAVNSASFDHSGGTGRIYVIYAALTTNDVSTVTMTRATGTASSQLLCGEFSGLDTGDLLDDFDSQENASGTSHGSGSVTTTVADEVIVAAFNSSTTASFTAFSNSFTQVAASVGSTGMAYRIVSSTGTYSTTATSLASEVTEGVIASFNGEAGSPAPAAPGRLLLMGVGGCAY